MSHYDDATVSADGKLSMQLTVNVDGRTGWQKFKAGLAGLFGGVAGWRLGHSPLAMDSGLARNSREFWSKRSTDEIIESLRNDPLEGMSVKIENGQFKIMNGNQRISVLQERGVDVENDVIRPLASERLSGETEGEGPVEPIP